MYALSQPTAHMPGHARRAANRLLVPLLCLVLLAIPGAQQAITQRMVGQPQLPLAFVPNVGQAEPVVALQTRAMGGTLSFRPDGMILALPAQHAAQLLRLQFMHANSAATVTGTDLLPGVNNYYVGSDPAQWHTGVPTYAGLNYHQLYRGIDLHYTGTAGQLKGTYFVAPQADPTQIQWRYDGARMVTVDAGSGDLHVAFADTDRMIIEHAPIAWQTVNGQQIPVSVHYAMSAKNTIGFTLGSYNRALPLILDPTLTYSTFLGGNSGDLGRAIAVDSAGNTYITGNTFSTNFPGTTNKLSGNDDIFVTKLNPQGSAIIWSTYLGGSGSDESSALVLDSNNNLYLAGNSDSPNFPTHNAAFPTQPSNSNAVVVKLANAGTIAYSTYLGIQTYTNSVNNNLAVDHAGSAYVTGRVYDNGYKVAVAKFSPDGSSLVYGVDFGSGGSEGHAIAVDSAGNAYLTGITGSPGTNTFPVTDNAIQSTCGGQLQDPNRGCQQDAFVSILGADGTQLLYSTYLGGNWDEEGHGIALDAAGNIYVTGTTFSTNFPTHNAFQSSCPGGLSTTDSTMCSSTEGFVTKLSAGGTSFIYSTYLAGLNTIADTEGFDSPQAITTDNAGNAYVTGMTNSTQFPLQHPVQAQIGRGICDAGSTGRNCYDAFVTQFAPDGTVPFSTYLGGSDDDYGYGIALDQSGSIYLTGATYASDFPTTSGVLQSSKALQQDAFVAKIGGATGAGGGGGGAYKVYIPLVRR